MIVDRNHTLAGATKAQAERLSELLLRGATIRLTAGVGGNSGIQHSKTLLVDREFLNAGSANWTINTRSNEEINVLIRLSAEGLKQYEERIEYMLGHSVPYQGALELRSHEHREARARAKSQEPGNGARAKPKARAKSADRYAFAKRFSLARERRVQQDLARARAEADDTQSET